MNDEPHGADAAYWKRIAIKMKHIDTILKQYAETGTIPPVMPHSRQHAQAESAGLYIFHSVESNSFFLMQRVSNGAFECNDRISFADAEAEGLDLRVGR